MNENKKKALAVATVVSFLVSNPINGYAEQIVENISNEQNDTSNKENSEENVITTNTNFEKDDSYHGTWQEPFIYPNDEEEIDDNSNETSGGGHYYNGYHTNTFRNRGWIYWRDSESSTYKKYKTYKESSAINKGKSSIKSSSFSSGKSS